MKQELITEIKFLKEGIVTAEKLIELYTRCFEDDPGKYQTKIVNQYRQINKYESLIGHIRLKLIKMGFNK